jgi:type I restriction enzyme S subunit
MNYSLKRFKELAMFINGRAFKPSEWKSNGLPIIRIQNLTDSNKNFNYFDGECENKFIVKKGDLLISWSASLGVYIWNKEDAVLNQHIFKVIVNENLVDKKYFFYATKRILNVMESRVHGATMKHITKDRFEDLKIPLPPLPTQRKIASILSACESAIEKRKYAMRLTDEFLKSAFLKMFGDPIKNPKGWEKIQLKDIIHIERRNVTPEEINQGTKYIGLEHIESITGKIIDLEIVNAGQIQSNKFIFTPHHILLGKLRPYLNKVALPDFTGVCSTDIFPIIPKAKLTNKYFLTFLLRHNSFVSYATERSTGANLPRINTETINEYRTYLPPLSLQLTFSSLVQNVEKMKEKQRESEKELNNLFNSLMQRAFRGELV